MSRSKDMVEFSDTSEESAPFVEGSIVDAVDVVGVVVDVVYLGFGLLRLKMLIALRLEIPLKCPDPPKFPDETPAPLSPPPPNEIPVPPSPPPELYELPKL